jgi:lipoprotein-releasing system permease protein
MTFEWTVALRYLRSPHKPVVLRLITLLAVLGVAAGVGTLVLALAMNSGFRQTLQERILGATAHINLTRPAVGGIQDYRALLEKLRSVPEVRAVAPAIYQTVLLSSAGRARGILLKGIDPALEIPSNEILRRLADQGPLDFSPDKDGIDALLIGRSLAQDLRISAGDFVTLTSPQGRLTPFGLIPRSRRFRVVRIFDSGFYDYDANWGFVSLPAAQGLAATSDLVGVLEFRIQHLDRTEQTAQLILHRTGAGYSVSTWMDQNRALFRALRLEKLVTAIFIGLITFVAGLNILVVLAMSITHHARDIAVLLSFGTRREQIRRIFVWQGLLVGALGTLIGLLLGYALAWAADTWHWLPLDPEVYAIPYVPFHANPFDAFWIIAATLLISVLATFYPARAAARLLPAEILRFE